MHRGVIPTSGLAMARQPLLYVRPKAKYRMPANALAERPELAALIGECIAFWSQVEGQIAVLLSAIMKAETAITAAVFLSIRNSRAQREALTAAAEIGLTGRELEMFRAIAIVYQSLDSQRTDLAHGIFAISEDLPDALLWIDSSDFTQHNLDFWIELMSQTDPAPLQASETVRAVLFVYRKDDFVQLRDEIKELWQAVVVFAQYLRGLGGLLTGEEQFQKLYTLPQIQRALVRLRDSLGPARASAIRQRCRRTRCAQGRARRHATATRRCNRLPARAPRRSRRRRRDEGRARQPLSRARAHARAESRARRRAAVELGRRRIRFRGNARN